MGQGSGRERRSEKQRKKWREQQRGRWFPYLATEKATTKLVHFLINNTRLKKSFEKSGKSQIITMWKA